jgi:hypothetical protein
MNHFILGVDARPSPSPTSPVASASHVGSLFAPASYHHPAHSASDSSIRANPMFLAPEIASYQPGPTNPLNTGEDSATNRASRRALEPDAPAHSEATEDRRTPSDPAPRVPPHLCGGRTQGRNSCAGNSWCPEMGIEFPEAFAPALPVLVAPDRGIKACLLKRHSRAGTDWGKGDGH